MRLVMLIMALLMSGAMPAVAGPFEDAVAASQKGDYATAVRHWRPLAEQGKADALYNFGASYHSGEGVPRDYAVAVAWYRKAADQGDDAGQYGLGVMYSTGRGVPQDYVQAHMWFNLSAAQDDIPFLATQYRDEIAAKMTPAQLAEAQKLAREWKPNR